ncbi:MULTISPECIES: heptaprenyl pyrophosphate synthase subunit A [unclassified Staphylococcus]|uniref:heptaprenyl pyrophosphate synthase subunit A n=1 Tax=unclassified Staphylococcus TaxID=91994 RepID=UPI00203AEBBE|nr:MULTISPECIES: heptaprenyl pyrophosphate synthase subunit A [unclassified Staphylococcus]
METTVNLLEKQISNRLHGVNHFESIYINPVLGEMLDSFDIPKEAKLACLTIDTAMRHLDAVESTLTSKQSILIGDLLSAHFYTILAQLNDPIFQKEISTAIVKINEIKSSIHNDEIPKAQMGHKILLAENTFPFITLKRYAPNFNKQALNRLLLEHIQQKRPAYLNKYSNEDMQLFISNIKTEIDDK